MTRQDFVHDGGIGPQGIHVDVDMLLIVFLCANIIIFRSPRREREEREEEEEEEEPGVRGRRGGQAMHAAIL